MVTVVLTTYWTVELVKIVLHVETERERQRERGSKRVRKRGRK